MLRSRRVLYQREKVYEEGETCRGYMIKLCLAFIHSGGKSVYACACVFKLPESFRSCYSFKRHSHIDVRGGGRHQEAWEDHIVCAVGRLGRKAWVVQITQCWSKRAISVLLAHPVLLTET